MLKDVYIIKNTINNKVYIGQAINTQKRFTSHKSRSKLDLDNSLKQNDDRNILKNRKNIEDIFYLLKESSCSMEQIGKYFNVSRKVIERINKGETYYQNISYSLRTQRKRSVETVEQALLKGGR